MWVKGKSDEWIFLHIILAINYGKKRLPNTVFLSFWLQIFLKKIFWQEEKVVIVKRNQLTCYLIDRPLVFYSYQVPVRSSEEDTEMISDRETEPAYQGVASVAMTSQPRTQALEEKMFPPAMTKFMEQIAGQLDILTQVWCVSSIIWPM